MNMQNVHFFPVYWCAPLAILPIMRILPPDYVPNKGSCHNKDLPNPNW